VASSAVAQSAVATLTLSSDKIGEIKTAPGITTMVRFPDAVQEIICGDLYDPGTGKGTFVVQRSGPADHPGNEVFIKPVSVRGASNMFVKTDLNADQRAGFLTEIGFIIAFGVLLDTFLVRSVLVPALVFDIGPRIWWPSRLTREDGTEPEAQAAVLTGVTGSG
jgi:hypothetical protein